ncbi:HAD ATPase, P-type, family IC [Pelomyxa schiedti]|nr:HAD ATPase, P-type, family IC [Pelomyxa schiedti]
MRQSNDWELDLAKTDRLHHVEMMDTKAAERQRRVKEIASLKADDTPQNELSDVVPYKPFIPFVIAFAIEARALLVWRTQQQRIPNVASIFRSEEKLEAVNTSEKGVEKDPENEAERLPSGHALLSVFRCYRYFLKGGSKFGRVIYNWDLPFSVLHSRANRGVSADTRASLTALYGENLIYIPKKSIPRLFVEEILHPFYFFQLFSVILWGCELYYWYAIIIFLTSILSAIANMYSVYKNMNNLRRMAMFSCPISRFSNKDTVEQIDSTKLIPGDLVSLNDLKQIPCDVVLTSGYVIVNESSLTGESTPVLKSPLPKKNEEGPYNPDKMGKYTLYSGTQILCVKPTEGHVKALVIRTGYSTTKGMLMKTILYPPPTKFTFQQDSLKFIALLFAIAFGGIIYAFYLYAKHNTPPGQIAIRGLDLITIIVPPALPLALTIGTINAVGRLKSRNVYCISPKRVNEAGKVQLMTFDKTGTLTEEGLEVVGAITPDTAGPPSSSSDTSAGKTRLALSTSDVDTRLCVNDPRALNSGAMAVLTCCHSVGLMGDQLIGDPLDVKMVEFTKWHLEEKIEDDKMITSVMEPEPTAPGEKPRCIKILKRFDFTPAMQRQVVIAQWTHSPKTVVVVAKGAPEVVSSLCIKSTLPVGFERTLSQCTSQGYRVIACASKTVKASKIRLGSPQEEIEHDLEFQCLLILNNPLKPESAPTIQELSRARIRSVMATGDNLQTAISVARTCQILRAPNYIYLAEYRDGDVVWRPLEESYPPLDPLTLKPTDGHKFFQYALHSDAFSYYLSKGGQKFDMILVRGQVFARMKPDQKRQLVEAFENMGYFTGMCGDGTNDCGALKAARVGLSLAETEASIAAPFTSTVPNISSVLTLLKEGRCALATSFSLFKYMALYSMIQYTDVVLLYYTYCNLGNWHFLYQDVVLTLVLSWTMSHTAACKKLSKRKPTSSLISIPVFTSVIGQLIINIAFIVLVYVTAKNQDWWVHPIPPDGVTFNNSHPTAVVILISQFQLPIVAIVFSLGYPFMKWPWHNLWLLCGVLFDTAFNFFILFQDIAGFYTWYQLPNGPAFSSSSSSSASSSALSLSLSSPSSSSTFEGIGENPIRIPYDFRGIIVGFAVACFFACLGYELLARVWVPKLFGNTRTYDRRRFVAHEQLEQRLMGCPGKKVDIDVHCTTDFGPDTPTSSDTSKV